MYDFWKKHDFLLLSFCTQGLGPELQNPIVFKPYQSFSPRKKEFGRTDGGWLLNSHPPSATVPPLPIEGVSSLVSDSATSPFGFAQNDKGEFFLTIVKYIRRG